jgi:hypothetical protein
VKDRIECENWVCYMRICPLGRGIIHGFFFMPDLNLDYTESYPSTSFKRRKMQNPQTPDDAKYVSHTQQVLITSCPLYPREKPGERGGRQRIKDDTHT